MGVIFLVFIMVLNTQSGYSFPETPLHSPGHLCSPKDKDFLEYRYPERIHYCRRNVSTTTRKKVYAMYGVPWNEREHFSVDHVIPLSVGGSNSLQNLWPEHLSIKCRRGNLEFKTYLQLRRGSITQMEAIEKILKSKFEVEKKAKE